MSWPRYMIEKALRSGAVAYYWNPSKRDVRGGFPLHREALGKNFAGAIERANMLNANLDAWRQGRTSAHLEIAQPGYGTVAWLFDRYLKSEEAFKKRVRDEHSRYEYRRACKRIEDIETTTGGRIADLAVSAITPGAVDKIYTKLQQGPRGHRVRQANLSIGIAARAWDAVWRMVPSMVPPPGENPWRGTKLDTAKATKPAATRAEAYALAEALREIGEPHLGAAALICFEWHQRPEHVRAGDITWADWRPPERPDAVHIRHPKTGAKGWVPLEDGDGRLFPEIEAYLTSLPRLGLPIVLTAGRRGPARPYSAEYAQRKVREARNRAGLGAHVTLDACRHGGLTELGDAGATDSEAMASSMHRTAPALHLYVKKTEHQRASAARKRRELIEANEPGARVRIGRQTKSQNRGGENV
jgi:hypothetical protein